MKEKTAWWIACGFLMGYIFAWGTIALDRYVIVEAQRELRHEIMQTQKAFRLKEIVDEADRQMKRHIEWNRRAIEAGTMIEAPIKEEKNEIHKD